ncbi:helix-turn-helix transcriptional regulator [Streptomyces sp. NPDC093252]|uniref:helix-turn-helix domain-containing protein n=1 Tax=Streptomyces sp. NPDC093252 TaxID=3154980 RepID=UPI00341E4457
MPRRQQATARQARLGTELRRLREAAGLKATEAAALLGTTSVQMSQTESGIAGVSEQRLRRMAANYACVDTELIDALVAMATDRTRGWWEEYRGQLPTSFLDLAELEHHATYRSDFEFMFIPGLLQTEEYARAAFASRVPSIPEAELELRVRHRMQRKTILNRSTPTPYRALIHEAALRIRVGDRATARTQLRQVLELSEADHITVQVIPFDLDGFGGTWSPMMLAGGAIPKLDTGTRDAPDGTGLIDSEAQLDVLRTLFRRVEVASVDASGSRDIIHALSKEL